MITLFRKVRAKERARRKRRAEKRQRIKKVTGQMMAIEQMKIIASIMTFATTEMYEVEYLSEAFLGVRPRFAGGRPAAF